ncbi:hypothetical protein M514_10625 [Trichuris suis]|uniref:deoxyribose-phosphate aldolase n=1 Tax=Trichuris suis TaxID=68888 RepID=A0A085NJQ5_9BILA|nr:hypothetical protein M513_10625 [Trichuris suis]KFD69701.1 hypothetical protein M514_10625 [Trichuris suis]KHJ46954.1 deoxyribose-phosphate aldolase [Trichuris suis]
MDAAFQPLSFERSEVGEVPDMFENIIEEAWETAKKEIKLLDNENRVDAILRLMKTLELPLLHSTCTGLETKFALDAAIRPLPNLYTEKVDLKTTCGGICLYPGQLEDCISYKEDRHPSTAVKISCVAGGFPDGQTRREVAWKEANLISLLDANETDVLCNRKYVVQKDWKALYIQLIEFKALLSAEIRMKAILVIKDMKSLSDMYRSCMVAMFSGSDFICLWTGEFSASMDYRHVYAACTAIEEFSRVTGRKVGLKIYASITVDDALTYVQFVKGILGDSWTSANYLRISSYMLFSQVWKSLFLLRAQNPNASNTKPSINTSD